MLQNTPRNAIGVAVLLVLIAAAAIPYRVSASHMVPSPHYFWDFNNDGTPDPTVGVKPSGTGWDATKTSSLDSALSTWSATDLNFYREGCSCGTHTAWVDGSRCSLPWPADQIAATCRLVENHGNYMRILDMDVYFNVGGWTWNFGSAANTNPSVIDFRGEATHELGHWIRLVDVYGTGVGGCNYGTGMYTMCGYAQNGYPDTYRYRSLTTHDIDAANLVY